MHRAGVDALTIQFHGGWTSDTFTSYTRPCGVSIVTVAEKMASGSGGSAALQ